jgi:DNA-binding response OmpR family regulator
MKLGATDFVQKPFSPGEIRELATRVLGRDTDPASAPAQGRPEGIGSRRESGAAGAGSPGGETVTGNESVSGGAEDEE